MDSTTQLTLGAIVALLILKEVFAFVRSYFGNGQQRKAAAAAGEQSVEFWQAQQTVALTTVVNAVVVPILARQTEILRALESASIRQGEANLKLQFTQDAIAEAIRHYDR